MPRIMSESGRVVEATTANHNPVLWGLGGETRQNPPKETAADAAPNPLQGCKDEGEMRGRTLVPAMREIPCEALQAPQ